MKQAYGFRELKVKREGLMECVINLEQRQSLNKPVKGERRKLFKFELDKINSKKLDFLPSTIRIFDCYA